MTRSPVPPPLASVHMAGRAKFWKDRGAHLSGSISSQRRAGPCWTAAGQRRGEPGSRQPRGRHAPPPPGCSVPLWKDRMPSLHRGAGRCSVRQEHRPASASEIALLVSTGIPGAARAPGEYGDPWGGARSW
eukprot:gene18505-biopygen888